MKPVQRNTLESSEASGLAKGCREENCGWKCIFRVVFSFKENRYADIFVSPTTNRQKITNDSQLSTN